jgi:hypothetical protein
MYFKALTIPTVLWIALAATVGAQILPDYNLIHDHPRIWMESGDSWPDLRAKIYGDATMRTRWQAFTNTCRKTSWDWTNVNSDTTFFFAFAQCLIGKTENDPSWYSTGAIPASQTWTPRNSIESDDWYRLALWTLVYDWLYDELTVEQKTTIQGYIEAWCDSLITAGEFSQDFSTQNEDYHNYHTQWITAALLSGLALHGDSTKATNYLNWALGRLYLDNHDLYDTNVCYNFMKSIKATGGHGLFEGPGYFKDAIPEIAWGIEAWDAATDRHCDLWGSTNYFVSMENAGYSIIYMHTPAFRRFKEEDSTYGANNYVTSYNMCLLSLLEKVFQNGTFLHYINDRWTAVGDWGSWDGGQVGRRSFYFLWNDPAVVSTGYTNLPTDRQLGDYVVLKNGWTTNDLLVVFKAGYHWKAHAHSDHGNFQFYRGSSLLSGKAGWYDTSSWATDSHRMAWANQTISGNCITIFDPDEVQANSVGQPYPNSGGQRLMNFQRIPPFPSGGTMLLGGGAMLDGGGHDVADPAYGVTNRYEELARYGRLSSLNLNQSNFTYLKADVTKAYANGYSGYGNNIRTKARLVQRELLYWRTNFVVVHDLVLTTKASNQTAFVTHQPYPPAIYSNGWQTANAGISDFEAASKARWDWGKDRVFQSTLYPTSNVKHHVVGGPSYSCYIESTGKDYSPQGLYLIYLLGGYMTPTQFNVGETVGDGTGGGGRVFYAGPTNYLYLYLTAETPFAVGHTVTGAMSRAAAVITEIHNSVRMTTQEPELQPWRIEVRPQAGLTTNYSFLNVFEVTTTGQAESVECELITATSSNMRGALIRCASPRIAIFSTTDTSQTNVSYEVSCSGRSQHLIADMIRGVYAIRQNGHLIGTCEVSRDELLSFESDGGGAFTVTPHTLYLLATTYQTAGEILLHWTSASNELYSVSYSETLLSSFRYMASNLPAHPPENTFTDRVEGAAHRFYRIELE